MGNVLTFTPPLTITTAQMHDALDRIDAALADARTSLGTRAG